MLFTYIDLESIIKKKSDEILTHEILGYSLCVELPYDTQLYNENYRGGIGWENGPSVIIELKCRCKNDIH